MPQYQLQEQLDDVDDVPAAPTINLGGLPQWQDPDYYTCGPHCSKDCTSSLPGQAGARPLVNYQLGWHDLMSGSKPQCQETTPKPRTILNTTTCEQSHIRNTAHGSRLQCTPAAPTSRGREPWANPWPTCIRIYASERRVCCPHSSIRIWRCCVAGWARIG